jgi:signal transduction histidine kinase
MQAARDIRAAVAASVLLVDDTEANLVAFEAVLEPLGCRLVRTSSGQEALRQVLLHDFAVILMDVMMPGLDGLATTGLIKKRPSLRHVPIIFLTAGDRDPKEVERGYALGAVDYLVKPFEPHILRSKVAVFVELFLRGEELKAQTELAQRRAREAIENRRLYESERQARVDAEAIAHAREEAIAIVSHDLRNPMSVVAANADIICRDLVKGDTDGALARAGAIKRGMARMDALVRDLLDTARIQSGSLTVQFEVEDVTGIVREVVELLGPLLAAEKQTLEVVLPAAPIRARCDRHRIFQVLSNLVGNASKFSPAGGSIVIKVTQGSHVVRVEVIDRGCGISADQLTHIFEPYWRASPTRQQGLGLGLAIAKGIVEAHGHRISVESRVGEGSQFAFELSLEPTGPESTGPGAARE